PQPKMTSSTSVSSTWGTLPRASLMAWAARSSGRVRLKEPRCDLARGVRELATTTASLMGIPHRGKVSRSVPQAARGPTRHRRRPHAEIRRAGSGHSVLGTARAYHGRARGPGFCIFRRAPSAAASGRPPGRIMTTQSLRDRIGPDVGGTRVEDALQDAVRHGYFYLDFNADLGSNHLDRWDAARVRAVRDTC